MKGGDPGVALALAAMNVLGVVVLVVLARLRAYVSRRARHKKERTEKLRVAFLHPDLGIGGAERLVVDAAISLQRRGHQVLITTAHHDKTRCFEETRDGTLTVHVAGSSVPRNLFGRLHIVCATARALVGAMWLITKEPACDAVVVDQVPAAVPLLRMCGVPVLFYCHFPDKLLAPGGAGSGSKRVRSMLRRAYRLPFDLLEEVCTGAASRVVVNSAYTASVYASSFPLLRHRPPPAVLHPCIDVKPWAEMWGGTRAGTRASSSADGADGDVVLVSLNRFERKKALELAVDALRELRASSPDGSAARRVRLVLAGGYDDRLDENVSYFRELEDAVAAGGMEGVVTLKRNVSSAERRALFASCAAVVYTPSYEHFGIVPLEAMEAARPVIAVGLGGPCESIVHGDCGWLCEPSPAAFADAYREVVEMHRLGSLPDRGRAARARVEEHFALPLFGERLEGFLRSTL